MRVYTVEEVEQAKKDMLQIMNDIPRIRPLIIVLDALDIAEKRIIELEQEIQSLAEFEVGQKKKLLEDGMKEK